MAAYQGRLAAMAVLSKPMAVLSRPAMRNCSFINNGKLIKAKLKEDSYAQPLLD